MPPSPADRLRGLFDRSPWPSERDWGRSALLEPRDAPAEPALVSDGGGLPFPPSALDAPAGQLPMDDPATEALLAMLAPQKTSDGRMLPASTRGWRTLARIENEVLFGHGLPPELVTVALRRNGRRGAWTSVSTTRQAPLRTVRDGVRASGWRLDPEHSLDPEDTILRVLVTEQSRAGGASADRRLLAPDLHLREAELVLTMFITPRPGFQQPAATRETLARITLPEPLGRRELIDGALFEPV